MAGTAATTESFACLAFRRALDLAAPAVPAAADAVSETLSVTVDVTVDAPAVADTAGFRPFDNSHAALPGRSLRPVLAASDNWRAGRVLAISPPNLDQFWLAARLINWPYPAIKDLVSLC